MSAVNVIPLPRKLPEPGELMKLVRKLAVDGAIAFGPNAFGQDDTQPEIDLNDAKLILQTGMIRGDIVPGILPGEWKCTVVDKRERSPRWTEITAMVISDRRIYVLTAKLEEK
jgi:hypothetical protein